MKTHNACIYHCVTCGRVVHAELNATPPQCCGHTMTKACSETVPNGDVAENKSVDQSEAPRDEDRKKPR